MADISDVEQAVVDLVTLILYPGGSGQSSIIGCICRIYRGWPNAATLNSDLSTETVNVTVISDNEQGRTTTRYLPEWSMTSSLPGTIVTASGQTITISGSPSVGDVVGLLVDGLAFVYRVGLGDSADLVASKLIQANLPVNQQGASITFLSASSLIVRVVCDSLASFESRRQEKDLRIICWCPTPPVRDAVAAAIDSGMARSGFLSLPSSAQARVIYRNTASYDQAQNALLYRRDLVYTIEYPTVTIIRQPAMIFGASEINGNIIYG